MYNGTFMGLVCNFLWYFWKQWYLWMYDLVESLWKYIKQIMKIWSHQNMQFLPVF